jgi:hypothetical protein
MASGLQRKTIYVGTVVAILALVSGFALASTGIMLTHHNQNASGDFTSTTGPVNGVTWVSTQLNTTNTVTMTVQTALGIPSAPVSLGAGMNVFCLSGNVAGSSPCTEGDFSEWANYSFTTSFTGAMSVTMSIITGAYSAAQTLYVSQPGTGDVAGSIVLVWDLGSNSISVNSVSVTLNQCSGATSCP